MDKSFNLYCSEQRKAWLLLFFKTFVPVLLLSFVAVCILAGAYVALVMYPEANYSDVFFKDVPGNDWFWEIVFGLGFTLNYISSGGWLTTRRLQHMYLLEKHYEIKNLMKS